MKTLSFTRVDIKTYNIFLCTILPLVTIALLYPYISLFLNFKTDWLFTFEFLKLIVIIMCYSVPVTYFLSKAYEFSTSGYDKTPANSILGFIACCVLVLPFVLIGLAIFAKISFFIPVAFTAATIYIYFRSLAAKLKPVTVK